MAGIRHKKDPITGESLYPEYNSLESNKHGLIMPNKDETKEIIKKNTENGRIDYK